MKTLKTMVLFSIVLQGCGTAPAAGVDPLAAVTGNAPACTETKTTAPAATETASEPVAKKAPATVSAASEMSEVAEAPAATEAPSGKAMKLTMEDCIDPDLSKYAAGETVTLCNGKQAYGGYVAPVVYAPCTRNGQVDCIATSTYAANNNSNLKADDLRVGVKVADVTGTYSPVVYTNCSQNGQTSCLATAPYAANDVTGLAASNIRSGVTVAGVAGSFNPTVESHTDCNSNNQVGCVTTASFKSIDSANMSLITAGNIKNGVTIAGVTGSYPSASTPLVGASSTADLDDATFTAKIKSVAQFEFFDGAGNRYVQQGASAIAEANIRVGVSIFGSVGTFGAVPSPFEIVKGSTVNGTAGLVQTNCRTDAAAPAAEKCTTVGWLNLDTSSTTFFQDRMTGKKWFSYGAGMNYALANNRCNTLTTDGGGWRLPSRGELQIAILHKIELVGSFRLALDEPGFWSGPSELGAVDNEGSRITGILSTDTVYKALCIK